VNTQCWFSDFLFFFHKKEPALYKYLDDITKSGTTDELHSIKMPESPDIEDYIYLVFFSVTKQKRRLAGKCDCS
jgi:hypothetical protein